jgi:hypothetical protein
MNSLPKLPDFSLENLERISINPLKSVYQSPRTDFAYSNFGKARKRSENGFLLKGSDSQRSLQMMLKESQQQNQVSSEYVSLPKIGQKQFYDSTLFFRRPQPRQRKATQPRQSQEDYQCSMHKDNMPKIKDIYRDLPVLKSSRSQSSFAITPRKASLQLNSDLGRQTERSLSKREVQLDQKINVIRAKLTQARAREAELLKKSGSQAGLPTDQVHVSSTQNIDNILNAQYKRIQEIKAQATDRSGSQL